MKLLTTRAVRKAGGQATPVQKEKDGQGLQRLAPRTLGQTPPAMRHSRVRLRPAEHSLAALGWEQSRDRDCQRGHAWYLWKGGGCLGKGSGTSRLSLSTLFSPPGLPARLLPRPLPRGAQQAPPPLLPSNPMSGFWSGPAQPKREETGNLLILFYAKVLMTNDGFMK